MKRILSFLVALMPSVCWGLDDVCTSPTNFTVDKRCYVTDEQKLVFPYNTVVGLIDSKGALFCTGTIIKKDNKTLIYTAKHCTDKDKDHSPDHTITIRTQNNQIYRATLDKYGNYDFDKHAPYSGDWAIYTIDNAPSDLPFTELTSNRSGLMGQINIATENLSETEKMFAPFAVLGRLIFNNNNYNARLVGYGSLKIMSDKEIEDFKDRYTNFLETNLENLIKEKLIESGDYKNGDILDEVISEIKLKKAIDLTDESPALKGLTNDEGIQSSNWIVREFIYGTRPDSLTTTELKNIFKDKNLKISFCQLDTNGYKQGCQSWSGNSGGPIFDDTGTLMGIHTHGNSQIGGKSHAGRTYNTAINDDRDKDGRPDSNRIFLK